MPQGEQKANNFLSNNPAGCTPVVFTPVEIKSLGPPPEKAGPSLRSEIVAISALSRTDADGGPSRM
jgi:hypothetical protein